MNASFFYRPGTSIQNEEDYDFEFDDPLQIMDNNSEFEVDFDSSDGENMG